MRDITAAAAVKRRQQLLFVGDSHQAVALSTYLHGGERRQGLVLPAGNAVLTAGFIKTGVVHVDLRWDYSLGL